MLALLAELDFVEWGACPEPLVGFSTQASIEPLKASPRDAIVFEVRGSFTAVRRGGSGTSTYRGTLHADTC
ncbi:hypothetical protein [Arthrobacter sp. EpRS71]|uniref:hypothetical protein n=1 Tax=Arthrobacter sp. EpRS71 TaxID=1743141 RepID=UPI0012E39575|nr:hypothetical protein [Arthrobacter sp. EpRS71]